MSICKGLKIKYKIFHLKYMQDCEYLKMILNYSKASATCKKNLKNLKRIFNLKCSYYAVNVF